MDPISTIGGVVGFAAQVLKTSKTIYDFIKSVRESPEEFRQLAEVCCSIFADICIMLILSSLGARDHLRYTERLDGKNENSTQLTHYQRYKVMPASSEGS